MDKVFSEHNQEEELLAKSQNNVNTYSQVLNTPKMFECKVEWVRVLVLK